MNSQSASKQPGWKHIERGLLMLAGTFFVAGAMITIVDVALRAISTFAVPAVIEITTLFIGFGAVFSMPVCFLRDRHVTAKLLSEFIPSLGRKLSLLATVFSALFAVLLTLMIAMFARSKWGGFEMMPDTGLPLFWLLLSISAVFCLSALAALVGFFSIARGGKHYG